MTRSKAHDIDLAFFLKRVTFEDAYRRSHGDTEVARKAMAYRILEALSDLENKLNGETKHDG